jgi:hypothetical protein
MMSKDTTMAAALTVSRRVADASRWSRSVTLAMG